jgi:two-component system, NarL family, sensor kinase
MKWLLIFLPLLLIFPKRDQESRQDNLVREISINPFIESMLDQCSNLRYTNLDSSMAYCRKALELSMEQDYYPGRIRGHLLLGILHDVGSQYDSALFHYRSSLQLSHEIGDTLKIASNHANIGLTYYHMGNFRDAMDYFFNSLGYFEELNFSIGIASTYNNLGIIHARLENYGSSLDYYFKALEIREQINDLNGIGAALTNIGEMYSHMGDYLKALEYVQKSIEVKSEISDMYGLAISNSLMGSIYIGQEMLDTAEKYIKEALNISKAIESRAQEVNAYLVYQRLYVARKQYREAIKFAEKALELSYEIGHLQFQSLAYNNLSSAHEALGNTSQAFGYYRKYIEKKDSMLSRDRLNQVFQLERQHEREKTASEIALLNRQAEINNLQIEKQLLLISRRNTLITGIIIIFMISILMAWLYYNHQKSRQMLRLNRALADVQKQVARGAIEAEIRERQRIGEELHDSFGQLLSLIKLNLTKVQKMKDLPRELREEMLDNTVTLANKAFVDLRDISHNMSPIMLQTKGLVLSVKDLINRIEESNHYTINFEVVDMDVKLEPFIEFTLLRTIQEMFNNIINHAHASEITVQIIRDGNYLNIMVEDDGVGFEGDATEKSTGMGLKNAYSRIKNLNGEMIIDSVKNRGTIISIIIPLIKDVSGN